jgi:hypothetical protein
VTEVEPAVVANCLSGPLTETILALDGLEVGQELIDSELDKLKSASKSADSEEK